MNLNKLTFCSKRQDGRRRTTEHGGETLAARRSPKGPYGAEKSPTHYLLPLSVPNSSFSSPSLSPHRSTGDIFATHHGSPQVFQVWSAPELAPSDMMPHPHQMSFESNAYSVDSSPVHNPRISIGHNVTSPSGPRLSTDTPTARRDTSSQSNVHPLPRPPAAAVPSQSAAPSPKVTAKPERVKSRWKKGKLLGRGTFGSVYVGSNRYVLIIKLCISSVYCYEELLIIFFPLYRETGALCAMKEVELVPDDPKSTECIRQLEQVGERWANLLLLNSDKFLNTINMLTLSLANVAGN